MEKRDVVIVGGGPAGCVIVHKLYASDRGFSVTLIKNEEINANRCAVPYGIPDKKPIEKFQISNKLVTDFGAELVVDQVEKIDPDKKEVFTKEGRHFSYGNLVLATGSRPVVPPIPGVNVTLGNGMTLPVDFVVLSAGVVPNTELASQAGIKTSRFGICVDEYMRTSSDHVYSCGDCVEKRSFITNQPTRGEFGTNAVFMAKITAQNILGGTKKFPGVINANATSVFDLSLGSAGLTEQMAIDAGLNVVSGRSEVLDKYPMTDKVSPTHTKLVFNLENQKLIGGSILGNRHGTAQHVDFISLAIQMGATMDDLLTYQYCTHPELAAKPSDNSYVFAARDAFMTEKDSYY